MTISDIAHRRLYSQHLARPDFETPADVVRWFGAIQAQDFLGSLYAIRLRMPAASEPLVEGAIADRTIVRTWPMRGTIHFVPAEDALWMLKLLASPQNARLAGMYRKVGLTGEIFARAGNVLEKALRGDKQLARTELYMELSEAGIETAGDQRGLHILGYWAREGLICLGPRRGKQATFALLDEWIPDSTPLEGEEALATLARRYFMSHGPATEYDFAWWTGLTITWARRAMRTVEQELVHETVDGRTYWSGSTAPALAQAAGEHEPAHAAYLLPAFDEFTVAYRDRSAFLDPSLIKEALYGIGPSIIIDGRLLGTWKRTLKKDQVIVSVNPLAPLSVSQQAGVTEAAQRYGKFLGLSAIVEITEND